MVKILVEKLRGLHTSASYAHQEIVVRGMHTVNLNLAADELRRNLAAIDTIEEIMDAVVRTSKRCPDALATQEVSELRYEAKRYLAATLRHLNYLMREEV